MPIGRDISQGHQHKRAFMKPRVGDGQMRTGNDFCPKEEDVEIEGARSPTFLSPAAKKLLDGQAAPQQLAGGKFSSEFHNGIQKRRLAGRSTDRLGFVKPGLFHDLDALLLLESRPCPAKILMPVTEIGTKCQKCGFQNPPITVE